LIDMASRAATLQISDPDPFGEVALAPAAMCGRSESQLAGAMARALVETRPDSASQALKQLRLMFPESPLTARVAALNALMGR
jgi:hypothetical protein